MLPAGSGGRPECNADKRSGGKWYAVSFFRSNSGVTRDERVETMNQPRVASSRAIVTSHSDNGSLSNDEGWSDDSHTLPLKEGGNEHVQELSQALP